MFEKRFVYKEVPEREVEGPKRRPTLDRAALTSLSDDVNAALGGLSEERIFEKIELEHPEAIKSAEKEYFRHWEKFKKSDYWSALNDLYPDLFRKEIDLDSVYLDIAREQGLKEARTVFEHNAMLGTPEWKYGFPRISYREASKRFVDRMIDLGSAGDDSDKGKLLSRELKEAFAGIKPLPKKKEVLKAKKAVKAREVVKEPKVPKLRWYFSDKVKGEFVEGASNGASDRETTPVPMEEADLRISLQELPVALSGSNVPAGFHYQYYDKAGKLVDLYIRREVRAKGANQKFTISFGRKGGRVKNYIFFTENTDSKGLTDSMELVDQILKEERISD